MTTISEVPGSIEGERILLTGLKILPQGRPIFTKEHDLVFQVSVQRRADAEITDEFSPLQFKVKPDSKLEAGTKISGQIIWGYCASPLTPSDVITGGRGRSGNHSGQELTMVDSCFAELIHGWRGDALLVHPKDELLSNS